MVGGGTLVKAGRNTGIVVSISLAAMVQASEPSRTTSCADVSDGLAQSLHTEIAKRGPHPVAAALRQRDSEWGALLNGISCGNQRYMGVGRELTVATDAGRARELNLAFGEALPSAPEAVLRFAPELRLACGSLDDPFIGRLDTALAEVDRRIRSVGSVRLAELEKERAACLRHLRALRAALPKTYE